MENTPEAITGYLRSAEYRNTDWFQALFNNNIMHSHSVSLTSGTEKSSYYASLSACTTRMDEDQQGFALHGQPQRDL